MKKFAVGIMVGAAACAANAQSSVTVYGSVDGGLDWLSDVGGQSAKQMNSGRRSPDRFGFRGVEDLGDGLAATFRLESGFNLDTGASIKPTAFFNRASEVGLRWNNVGLTIGHMADYMYEFLAQHSNGVPGISAFFSPGNFDNLANQNQLDNAVKVQLTDLNGWSVGGMVAASEGNGPSSHALGIQYRGESLRVSAAYTMQGNRTVDVRGIFGLTSFVGQTIPAGAQFVAHRSKSSGLGVSYDIGVFTPHVLVTNVQLQGSTGATATEHNAYAGVIADLSGGARVDLVHVSVGRTTLLDRKFTELNLFGSHAFSKRTQIYAGVGKQRAINTTAGFYNYGKSGDGDQILTRVGLQVFF